jgi:GWxTD domain-containing protein
VAQRESTAAAAPRLDAVAMFDISHEPAGGYDLEVKAWQEGDPGALLRRAHFSIAWKRDSWTRNPRDIEDPVHFLLTAEAEDSFAVLHPGEQERYLDEFWKVRDPTPETAENEALNTFLERVAHANAIWGRGTLIKGIFSDMGRTYIRYGQPDEVYHEVIPAGNETLLEAVRALSLTEDRPIGDVGLKPWGGETRPFEVWIYEHNQDLPPDADPRVAPETQRRRRLVFLFVDEQGLGDYRLRYSTE